MPSHNQLIRNAMARSVRAGTSLQDAILKVRRARRKSETEFEIALGQLFVLSSDAFKERNGLRAKLEAAERELKGLRDEMNGQRIAQNS